MLERPERLLTTFSSSAGVRETIYNSRNRAGGVRYAVNNRNNCIWGAREAVNNRSNSIGGAIKAVEAGPEGPQRLLTTGATALGGQRAVNNRRNSIRGGMKAANNTSNGAGGVRETVNNRIKGAGGAKWVKPKIGVILLKRSAFWFKYNNIKNKWCNFTFRHYYLIMFRLFVGKKNINMILKELYAMETWKMTCPQRKFHYLKLHCRIQNHNIILTITFHG